MIPSQRSETSSADSTTSLNNGASKFEEKMNERIETQIDPIPHNLGVDHANDALTGHER